MEICGNRCRHFGAPPFEAFLPKRPSMRTRAIFSRAQPKGTECAIRHAQPNSLDNSSGLYRVHRPEKAPESQESSKECSVLDTILSEECSYDNSNLTEERSLDTTDAAAKCRMVPEGSVELVASANCIRLRGSFLATGRTRMVSNAVESRSVRTACGVRRTNRTFVRPRTTERRVDLLRARLTEDMTAVCYTRAEKPSSSKVHVEDIQGRRPRRGRRNGLCVAALDAAVRLTRKTAPLDRGSATAVFFDAAFQSVQRGAAQEFPEAPRLQIVYDEVSKLPNMFAEIRGDAGSRAMTSRWVLERQMQIFGSVGARHLRDRALIFSRETLETDQKLSTQSAVSGASPEYIAHLRSFPRRHRRHAFVAISYHIPLDIPGNSAGKAAASAYVARATNEIHEADAFDVEQPLTRHSSCSSRLSVHAPAYHIDLPQLASEILKGKNVLDRQLTAMSMNATFMPTFCQQRLRSLSFLARMPENDVRSVIQSCVKLRFSPGDAIEDDSLIVLQEGAAMSEDCQTMAKEGDIIGDGSKTKFVALEHCIAWKVDWATSVQMSNAKRNADQRLCVLMSIPLLSALTRLQHKTLVNALEVHDLSIGDVVVTEGTPGNQLTIVEEGTCDVKKGKTVTQTLQPGMWIGETFLLFKQCCAFSVVVTSGHARILTLSRRTQQELLGSLRSLIVRQDASTSESSESE